MTAVWMLASSFVAVLLACAAVALTRTVALYRDVSLRWLWTLATLASVVVALLWLRPKPSPAPVSVRATALTWSAPATSSAPVIRVEPVVLAPARIWSVVTLSAVPRTFERALFTIWACASLVLALLLASAAMRLRMERRGWVWREVANTRVLVSKAFGPALVGVHRPTIVLPEWVLELDASSQRAIVAHEVEHRAAGDPELLLAGLAAVVLMPWNIGLWMSWRGLRRAIELDCDARVLARGIDGGEYARVLLGAWKSSHGSSLPSTAFAERASGLGARVEHLMRPEPRRRAMRVVTGTSLAAGLILVACVTPSPQRTMNDAKAPYPLVIIDGVKRPDLPPTFRYTGAVVVETTTTPTYRITYRGPRVMDSVAKALYPSADEVESMQMIDPPASVVHFGEEAKYGATLYYTKKYRAAGGAIIAPAEGNRSARRADPSTTTSEMAGRAYDHMFAGITLTPDVAARARAIVENEMTEQRALVGPGLATWPRRVEMNVKRDAELRALLTSDADRARFDVRSNESPTRGAISMEQVEGSEYGNLFVYPNQNQTTLRGPVLPADAQVRARAIIRSAINDELVLYARAPNAWKDAHDARVAIRAKRDADLRALVPTEEEIAKFDKIAARLRELTLSRP